MDSNHDNSDNGEEHVNHQTYIVIEFAKTIRNKTLLWIVDKIVAKRRHGGAELLLRKQPHEHDQGIIFHISASKIRLLEGAEEMALLKPDLAGNIREFDLEHIEDFLPDKAGPEQLLTTSEMQSIVWRELINMKAQADEKSLPGYAEVQLYHGQSIIQLLENLELIERIHPLHDKEFKETWKEWYWALLKRQPIAEIREYFGEAVALYFNFLGFYTTALIIPMTLGFLQLIVSQETLAFFCVFNVIWVTVFLELWKRRCSELAFDWGTINMTSLDEPRPNYHGTMGIDAVSGKVQPQYPRWKTNMKN
ncbi:anoctamin-10-like [Ctenocephalides felis]|uniref:anoctamin-10-like n=1 Tax=Ctenocephalides felis TaxID=7515 RepID=UPI000E6E21E1|nr:anoctamin-10-like [Ctenocephalides felis]